eukprot:4500014-Alexandrium_andersonii.AAC.1
MSASLVGSEMCIRDSGGAATRRPGASRPSTPSAWTLSRRPCRRRFRRLPVSYTHLTLPTICSV